MSLVKGVTSFYRNFDFFDVEKLADRDLSFESAGGRDDSSSALKKDDGGLALFEEFSPMAGTGAAGNGVVCFGGSSGHIVLINRDLQLVKFRSHSERVNRVVVCAVTEVLVSLGTHQDIPGGRLEPFLNVFSIAPTDMDEVSGPRLLKSFRVFKDSMFEPILSMACLSDCSQIALGCANGTVLIFDLDLSSAKAPVVNRLFDEDPSLASVPVTGLHYREPKIVKRSSELAKASSSAEILLRDLLYVVTVDRVLCVPLPKGARPSTRGRSMKSRAPILMEYGGCDMNCSALDDEGRLVVAKSETILVYYGTDPRGVHAFPGDKKLVIAFKRYLVVVCAHRRTAPSGDSAHLLAAASLRPATGTGASIHIGGTVRSEVTIYDNDNKYIAYRKVVDGLTDIVCEWSSVLLLTANELLRLRDKELQEKLKEFFDCHLYQKGIDLARCEGSDEATVMEYYRQYGDWLYSKGEYMQAMEQYLRTIDRQSPIEPSYVIRKYLDAQKINALTQYLTELHKRGNPTPDHTTLLLNCYTKLKDKRHLDEFISPTQEARFDVDTAIRVCREAGLLTHARILAVQQKKHGVVIELLFEEALNDSGAVAADGSGDAAAAAKAEEATDATSAGSGLDDESCSDDFDSESDDEKKDAPSDKLKRRKKKKAERLKAEGRRRCFEEAIDYIYSLDFLNAEKLMKCFGKTLLSECPELATELLKSLCTDFSLSEELKSKAAISGDAALVGVAAGGFRTLPKKEKLRAKPEEFIHLFVERRNELRDFLEFLIDSESHKCSTTVLNTLLEIYMKDSFDERCSALHVEGGGGAEDAEGGERRRLKGSRERVSAIESKTMSILRNQSEFRYDMTHALALAKMYQMEEAVIFLYQSMHLYHEVIQHFRERRMHAKIIETCREFSRYDPSLWTHAFTYFIRTGRQSEVKTCLSHIASLNLLPPLMIIELLSQSVHSEITIDVLRDYLISGLSLEQARIEEDSREIDRLKEDMRAMSSAMHELSTKAKTFQSTKCASCLAPLELPTVHFLCGHSLHERCAVRSSGDHKGRELHCPKCYDKFDEVFSRQRDMQRTRFEHDGFFGQLKAAHQRGDAFDKVSEYFGRGVIH